MVLKPALPRVVNALHRSSICGKTGKWSWLKTRLKNPHTPRIKTKKKKEKEKEREKEKRKKEEKKKKFKKAGKQEPTCRFVICGTN